MTARNPVSWLARDSESPEVRGRPRENDQEQQQRMRIDGIGDGRPTEHWRSGARRPADDDVLRRRTLQEDRVDDGVPDQR